jgi:hypothetical protein
MVFSYIESSQAYQSIQFATTNKWQHNKHQTDDLDNSAKFNVGINKIYKADQLLQKLILS